MKSSLQSYLTSIGKFSLLTQEEEVLYGKQIQEMITVLKEPIASENQHLSQAQIDRIVATGKRAEEAFIHGNMRLVVSIAKQYISQTHHLDLMDIIQEGNTGLAKAVRRFDPSKGYRFSTYSYWWIRQAITRAISEVDREIRLPLHVWEKSVLIRKIYRLLYLKLGRKPTLEEVAKESRFPVEKITSISSWMQHPVSINIKVGKDEQESLGDFLEASGLMPEEYVDERLLQETIVDLLETLNPTEKSVIMLRYGFESDQPRTLKETGAILSLSSERIRQIQGIATAKLKANAAKNKHHLN